MAQLHVSLPPSRPSILYSGTPQVLDPITVWLLVTCTLSFGRSQTGQDRRESLKGPLISLLRRFRPGKLGDSCTVTQQLVCQSLVKRKGTASKWLHRNPKGKGPIVIVLLISQIDVLLYIYAYAYACVCSLLCTIVWDYKSDHASWNNAKQS